MKSSDDSDPLSRGDSEPPAADFEGPRSPRRGSHARDSIQPGWREEVFGARALVWVVDDSPLQIERVRKLLSPRYVVESFADPRLWNLLGLGHPPGT